MQARRRTEFWASSVAIALLVTTLAALGPMAYAGIYIDPLRQFWQPWPPDIVKGIGGVVGFAVTLGYVMYRKGRYTGFDRGAVAERASTRNQLEGRTSMAALAAAPETSTAALNPPPPP